MSGKLTYVVPNSPVRSLIVSEGEGINRRKFHHVKAFGRISVAPLLFPVPKPKFADFGQNSEISGSDEKIRL
jgi:hypothetical protein